MINTEAQKQIYESLIYDILHFGAMLVTFIGLFGLLSIQGGIYALGESIVYTMMAQGCLIGCWVGPLVGVAGNHLFDIVNFRYFELM